MTSPASPCRRRSLLLEAQALAQATDRIEDDLTIFRERDLPAFAAWFATHLVPERRRIETLEHRRALLTERHNEVRALVELGGITADRARALLSLEDRALATAPPGVREHLTRERRARREFIARDLEREFRARAPREPATAAPSATPADVTVVYRRLAKRLHPDAGLDPRDAPEARWRARSWRALQDARAICDLGAIEDLELVARVRQFDCADLTAAEASRAHAVVRREHDARASDLDRARRSIAWRFVERDPAAVLRAARTELRADARELRAEIARLAEDQPAPPRPRAAGRITATHQLSLFD